MSGLPISNVPNFQEFRRKLVNLVDPERKIDKTTQEVVKQEAIRLCSIFAKLYGDQLDRKEVWGKISSALASAIAKVSDADLLRFTNLVLESICADPALAVSNSALNSMFNTFDAWIPEVRHAFIQYIATHSFAIVAFARQRWEKVLQQEIEL